MYQFRKLVLVPYDRDCVRPPILSGILSQHMFPKLANNILALGILCPRGSYWLMLSPKALQ